MNDTAAEDPSENRLGFKITNQNSDWKTSGSKSHHNCRIRKIFLVSTLAPAFIFMIPMRIGDCQLSLTLRVT